MSRLHLGPSGHRMRESHQRAYHSDEDIALMRELNQAGVGYGTIGRKFPRPDGTPTPRSTVQHICTFRTRYGKG